MILMNYLVATRSVPQGAKAYLDDPNPGGGGERIRILVRSRGGRYVQRWEDIRRLENFRHKRHTPENKLEASLLKKYGNHLDTFIPSMAANLFNLRLYWLVNKGEPRKKGRASEISD